ncbi:MAG: DNA-directed RNA polymerase subunit beta [Chloroflexi bacterium]|nr:DNA-directed RNA polymerase subunit beta [Chloroflexota bacterium]
MTVATDIVSTRSLVPASKKSYARIAHVLDIPHLISMQVTSFEWFQKEGLRELLKEISPIEDFTGTRMKLRFADYTFGEPKYPELECRERDMTYSAPLRVNVELEVKETGEVKEQELFMGDFPLMTPNGTFVINGAERVVVSQLVRSPGVYFTLESDPTTGRGLAYGKLIPNRGAWLEFETSNKNVLHVKVDRKRKIPVTTLLRAIDEAQGVPESQLGTNERILAKFADVDTNPDHQYIATTLDKETSNNKTEALLDFYRRLRPGDPPTLENARSLLNSLFFNARRYDLGRVGRYKLNRRLELDATNDVRILSPADLEEIIRTQIKLNNGVGHPDDIDHLGNRRVRAVGELIQNQFRIGLLRMERVVRERMTIIDPEQATPSALINIRPVVASMKEFFGGSQLSIGSLATYGVLNPYGFIETPYRRVIKQLRADSPDFLGRYLAEDVPGVGEAGTQIDESNIKKLAAKGDREYRLRPFVSQQIEYLAADAEDRYVIAQANALLTADNHFIEDRIEAREGERFMMEPPDRVQWMDVSPKQILSVATSLIPFLEHNDAPRALMGSNMQRQAVPLIRPETPIVMTGVEAQAAQDSGQVILAEDDGTVVDVAAYRTETDGRKVGPMIRVEYHGGEVKDYPLLKFVRSNQGTCINQRAAVKKGDRVHKGTPLADSSSTNKGELALGQSVLCAFMSWQGYNFEDAIILSEALVRDDKFTSIHIEKHEVESRDTKLGPEEITRDIPNVGEESLRDLDENGIIRIGAEVNSGDILVGKITPKGETELTAEEKLLRAIFGEKAREVKDTSLRVPHGERGKVIDVKVFRRDTHDELPAGVNELVRVSIAQRRKVSEGDKMAGRHGNKGVVARILPVEDMPYLADGTPVDIVLNPIGVPSRMNVGQVLETHLGWAANSLGFRAVTPVFDGASDKMIEDELGRAYLAQQAGALLRRGSADNNGSPTPYEHLELEKFEAWLAKQGYDAREIMDETRIGVARRACIEYWLKHEVGKRQPSALSAEKLEEAVTDAALHGFAPPTYGKQAVYDGRTGDSFDQPVTVGYIYMLKLVHLVEDKIHARSTGPYSLITQQPLGGKAQFGGQRFGEMEVWALEAYGAAHILQELLTVKSDDIVGRVKAYESIVKGEDVMEPGVPESFKVLVKELQSLGLSVEVLNEDEESVEFVSEGEGVPELGINLSGFESEEKVSA